MTKRIKLQVLIIEDKIAKCYVAHCLDYLIFAQAESLEEIWDAFDLMLAAHIDHALMCKQKPFTEKSTGSGHLRDLYNDGDPLEWHTLRPSEVYPILIDYAPVVSRPAAKAEVLSP